ncbi:polyketide synthase [Rhizobium rhizosphaerae]|uniref:Polyketide synthase n=1 Tax=Xaviernesmea rhizosphaerae TaxID=1672749 RepID=A0A1Q9ADI5_9HYPH|nr:type I polyketide synthase [Xaviernesmea rhizosphaerae]OLP52986.1 polyketide synthase [Xaviernesmea rhizosphaerae]
MHDLSAALPEADDNRHRIAVIGMSARLPGAADLNQFWQNLVDGRESVRRFTEEDLRASGVADSLRSSGDFVPAGAPLDGADRFDAAFFGYSPAEAEILDPQQRIFLECAWEALETAGYAGEAGGGAVGVFAAAGINTYLFNLRDNGRIRETVSPYEIFVSNDKDFLATRTAFKLNLTGPAITVQTACSSSLVAVHMAAQSLLSGDCDMALAGGVALSYGTGYRAREGGILSPGGHCRAFDAASGGTVPGSGVGIVVLKRLEDALIDGDTIDAVLLGSAINNDGARKASFTAPQVDSQAAVIADALAMAGVAAESIGYVEAHGTGTALGDPIEVAALTKAFRRDTDRKGFCALGSVKTNIGHLDTAAGIAGLIKAVLALKHRQIPASLHYETPNPQIDFARSPFFVNAALRPWQDAAGPRRAGVSSFGIGGTNAHVVLEEAPPASPRAQEAGPQLLLFSARSPRALARTAARLADRLAADKAPALVDVAFTLRAGRRGFGHRQFVVAGDRQQAVARLRALADGGEADLGQTAADAPAEAVFLFPGQGSPYPAMGKALHAALPAFREAFDACARLLDRELGIDFKAWLFSGDEEVHRTDLAQPALFAVEYALARLMMAHGVRPVALHGHSIGEYAAACIAGIFDLETAIRLVVARGRLMQSAEPGAMLAIIHPGEDIGRLMSPALSLAAANAPGLSVLSGATDAIIALEQRLTAEGIASRRLKTSHAFHGPMMAPAAATFRALLSAERLSAPTVPLISNVTGTWMTPEQATDSAYWTGHLLQTVRFEEGTRTLMARPNAVFLELGPGRTLGTFTAQTGVDAQRIGATMLDTAREREAEQTLEAIGRYWQRNGSLQPEARQGRRVALPTYPFESTRHWIEPDDAQLAVAALPAPKTGPTLSRIDWRRAMAGKAGHAAPRGRILLFDDGHIGPALAEALERGGAEPYRAQMGSGFAEPDYRCFTLHPQAADDYTALLDSLDARGAAPRHVVFAWPLAGRPEPEREQRPQQQDAPARALLLLVRALARDGRAVTLTVVTRNAIDATGLEPADTAQALVAGMVRVIGQEYPALTCRHIDIDDAPPARLAPRLRDALGQDAPEITLRGPHCWRPETREIDGPEGPGLKPSGVYVLAGTLAEGVGKAWEQGLAALPGAKLALLQPAGASVIDNPDGMTLRLDPADPTAVREALDTVAAHFGRIDGVFLAMPQSGETSAALIADLQPLHWRDTLDRLALVESFAAALAGRKLGFCCVQSSLSTQVGGLGLSAYAAGHAAIDRLVAEQAKAGETGWLAIGYPLIAEGPVPSSSGGRKNAFAVSPEAAWDFTAAAIASGISGRLLLSGAALPPADTPAAVEETAPPDAGRSRPPLATAYRAPRTPTEATITGIFEELLGLAPVGVDDGFYELGGHSLLAIRAVARLREAFPVDIAMRDLLFDNPTAAAIAATIDTRRMQQADLAGMADLLDEVTRLSDADVDRLLAGGSMR